MALGEYVGSGSAVTLGLYRLNGNANDSSGNGTNGTATNISWVDGKLGGGAEFNGTSSLIHSVAPLASIANFTISCWLKTDDVANYRTIYSSRKSGGGAVQVWTIRISNTGKIEISNQVTASQLGNKILSTGVWYHVLVTRATTTTWTIYIDGLLDRTFTLASATTTPPSDSANGPHLGYYSSGAAQYWDGLMDEVIIENRVRTPIEIQKYYTYAKGRFGI